MKQYQNEFSVEKMCNVLNVSTSGYYKYTKQLSSQRKERRAMLKLAIQKAYTESKGRYGSPRICKELNINGIQVSKILVAKLMKEMYLKSIVVKKYRVTTDSRHSYPVADNKLNREFIVKEQNTAWVSDITYIRTAQGWLYLTTVIDLFDRKVIGWSLSSTMKTNQTAIPAFKMAQCNRPLLTNQSLIFHSDRGIQYACEEFTTLLDKHPTITRSMSRKGNCWDNAVAESFFKTLKAELTNHYKYKTIEEAQMSVFEYIEAFYNTKRRHTYLNNQTINEFNQSLNNKLKNVA